MKRLLWVVVVLLLSMHGQANAATLNFNDSGSLAALKASGTCATWNNEWDYSAGEFSCNAQVTFGSGDQIRTTSASVIIRGNAGISGSNLSVGTSTNRVNLTTTHGTLQLSGSSTVYGNLQTSSGSLTVQSSTVNGSLTSSGALTLNAATISGSVSTSGTGSITNNSNLGAAVSIGNGLTSSGSVYLSTLAVTNGGLTTNTSVYHGAVTVRSHILSTNDTFLSNVTSTNGRLEFTGGSVTGLIYTPCCTLTTTNTNLAGGATVQSGITITGGTIAGDYTMTSNNPAVLDSVTMTSGSITSASTVTITNSTLGSDTSPILVTAVSGSVTVNNSEVFGDITTPSYGTVYVNGTSEVVGSCVPIDEPLNACGGVGTVTRESYWRFDEALWNGTSNEVKDSSLEAKDGTARNNAAVLQLTPSPASCTYGDFQAAGASSHPFVEINRNSYFHDSDEFGYTLWLKMNASAQASGSQTIMAYGGPVSAASGRFQLTRESGGNLRFSLRMTGGNTRYVEVSGTNIFNDQWQHIAFSYSKNSRRMRLYVNNVLVDDTPNSSIDNGDTAKTPNDGTGNFAIAALPDGTSGIRGQIDEVRFFNRELSTADIANMFEQEANCPSGGLVLGWDLNQGLWSGAANEVIDFSGNNLHGRTYNAVQSLFDNTALSGDPGTCSFSQFNGSNQYIETSDNDLLDITSALTLSLWVKPASRPASGLMTLVSKDNNYEIHQQPDGKVQWWWNDATATARQLVSATALTLNQWNHVVIVYASGTQKIFINGVQDATSGFTGTLAVNSSPLQLGQDQGSAGRYFNGFLDELRIYNSALATPAVQALQTERRACSQCFTENFYTTENWYASAYGGSEMPSAQTSPQRLRLTRNITNQATSMTIRKKFPGIGNKVSVEFNYYAWKPATGGGADGIAVTLSDATYTPAPGSFGGSLGYAQRTSPNDPGFNGGWIGIGLDEFGNFSNPTEGRQGGLGFRPQAVAVRGSLPNYNYLTGVTVTPNVDVVGTGTPGPGHRYRITVDATTTTPTQQALVKVERDTTGTGNSYTTIVNNYDAAAAAGQAAVPEDFFLSFTGATGSSVNNHEIATIQVCTVQPAPEVIITPPSTVHHYELNYVSNGVTCEAEQIEVKACADQSCSTLATAAVSTTISATNGGSFVGGTTLNFTGSTIVTLQQTNAGETTLAVAGGTNANVCSTSGCKINFATAGFKFYNSTSNTDDLQNQVAGVQGSGYLRAVQTNTNTMACEARVVGTRNVSMSYNCVNPGSCITGQTLQLGAVSFNGNEEGSGKNVSLTFDAQGYAPLSINYSDVGQLTLSASLALAASGNNPAVTLVGQSDTFVVRPHRINVTTALSSATADPANAANPQTQGTGAGFVAAGENFQLYVSPVNAQGNLTPNYGNETTPENVAVQFGQLLYPVAGVAGILTSSAAFEKVSSGPYVNRFHSDEVSWNEVGTIALNASVADGNYMGTGLGAASASTAYAVGRFYPAEIRHVSSTTANACNNFTYMDQPGISLSYALQALNRSGQRTQNYGVGYQNKYKLMLVAEHLDNGANLASRMDLTQQSIGNSDWILGENSLVLANQVFSKPSPLIPADGPFAQLELGLILNVNGSSDLIALSGSNMNATTHGDCATNSSCTAVKVGSPINLRYGRLQLENAFGPEDEPLPVIMTAQYWNSESQRFLLNTDDNCTAVSSNQLSVSGVVNSASGSGGSLINGQNLPNTILLAASGVAGTASLTYQLLTPPATLPYYLGFPWSGGTNNENPQAEAIFGRYRGNKRQIFWQEKLN